MLMRELRGSDAPVPDTVPDDLVAIYGQQARDAVRSRRSRWFRIRSRVRAWSAAHDPAFLAGAIFLWVLIVVCLGTAMALAAMGRPGATLDAGALGAVAGLGSGLTVFALRRHRRTRPRW